MATETGRPKVSVERLIQAPIQAVFDAWITPSVLTRWWGPKGVEATEASLDPRPGGRYEITMQPASGVSFVVSGEYRELDPPHRIVKTWSYSGEQVKDPVESVVTVELSTDGAATRVIVTQEFLGDPPDASGRARGWESMLGCLAEFLVTDER